MKKPLFIINTGALIIAISWMIISDFDYEPTIAVLTLAATLIGLIIAGGLKKKNKVTIEGQWNTAEVDVRNKKVGNESESNNELNIRGTGHNIKVDTDNK